MKRPSIKTENEKTYLMLGNKKVMECGGLIKEAARIRRETGTINKEDFKIKNRRDRNDTDVLIETYTIRIQNHKAKIKELKKLAKKVQKWIDEGLPKQTPIMISDYADRAEEIKEEIVSRKESISDYRYDIRHLKKLLKKGDFEDDK